MTPTLPEILMGIAVAVTTPLPDEASGDYARARAGMVAMLAGLAAQEAERGAAARIWENAALQDLFARVAGDYEAVLGGPLPATSIEGECDQTWSGLDKTNADLRRRLIALHVAVEARGDGPLHGDILRLYVEMAQARHLNAVI